MREKTPQIKENNEISTAKPNTFVVVLELSESLGKSLTVFLGTIYVIGYAITATRLAQFGIPAVGLLDAQYFAAGLLSGLLVWITIFVLVSALSFERTGDASPALKTAPFFIIILFVALLIVDPVAPVLSRS